MLFILTRFSVFLKPPVFPHSAAGLSALLIAGRKHLLVHFQSNMQVQPFAFMAAAAAAGHCGTAQGETVTVRWRLVTFVSSYLLCFLPSDVGKSSLLLRFADNSFSGEQPQTLLSCFPNPGLSRPSRC